MVKIWNCWILWTIGIKAEVLTANLNELVTPYSKIIISNHRSHLDSLVLWSIMPKEVFLCFAAKKELFKIPIFGTILKYSGSIIINREDAQSAFKNLKDFFSSNQKPKTLVMYAEGTRGKGNKLLPFKRGPFVIANEMNVPILPIIIKGTEQALQKGKFWPQPIKATVKILSPIGIEKINSEEPNKLRNYVQDSMQAEFQD